MNTTSLILLLLCSSIMFLAGALSHEMVHSKEPTEVIEYHEIETPWIEFKNGLKKDM